MDFRVRLAVLVEVLVPDQLGQTLGSVTVALTVQRLADQPLLSVLKAVLAVCQHQVQSREVLVVPQPVALERLRIQAALAAALPMYRPQALAAEPALRAVWAVRERLVAAEGEELAAAARAQVAQQQVRQTVLARVAMVVLALMPQPAALEAL